MAWFKKTYCGRSYSPPYSNTALFIFCIRERTRMLFCSNEERAVQNGACIYLIGSAIGVITCTVLGFTGILPPLPNPIFLAAWILLAITFGFLAVFINAFVFAMSRTIRWSKPRYTYKLIQSYKFR